MTSLSLLAALMLGQPIADEATTSTVAPTQLIVLSLALKNNRVDAQMARTLDELIAAELSSRAHLKVTTTADIETLFEAEMLKDLVGCDDVVCSSEIGGAIGADRILTGSIGHLGEDYVLSLRWLDPVYSESLAHVSERVSATEKDFFMAVRRSVAKLLGEAAPADELDRKLKARPTFWTSEFSVGSSFINAPETYDIEANAAARLAWGGRQRGGLLYYSAVGGASVAYFHGGQDGPTGDISYNRMQLTPFAELRVAVPLHARRKARLYAGAGAGLTVERFNAKQSGGLRSSDTILFPEMRLLTGGWYRWHRFHSFFVGYLFRLQFRGAGADSISELIQIGSTKSRHFVHAIELGWALHF